MLVPADASVPVHARVLRADPTRATQNEPVRGAQRYPHSHRVQMSGPAATAEWVQPPGNRRLTGTYAVPRQREPFPSLDERSLLLLLQPLKYHAWLTHLPDGKERPVDLA